MMQNGCWRVVLSYACYAVFVADGIVTKAAPIARWAHGLNALKFKTWVEKKGGSIEFLEAA